MLNKLPSTPFSPAVDQQQAREKESDDEPGIYAIGQRAGKSQGQGQGQGTGKALSPCST